MATEIVVTKENVYYTLRNSNFLLTDERCDVLLNDFAYLLQTEAVKESLLVSEEQTRAIRHIFKEMLNVADSLSNQAEVVRAFKECVALSDTSSRAVVKAVKESLLVSEEHLRVNELVYSSLVGLDRAIDKDAFLEIINTLEGYEYFRPFVTGDYEYQKALVKVSLILKSIGNHVLVNNVIANIDIKDVDDRGSVSITNTSNAKRINFTKIYYNPPEVQVSLVGGIGNKIAIPIVVSVTNTYFDCEIRDSETNNRVQGVVSWSSKGW